MPGGTSLDLTTFLRGVVAKEEASYSQHVNGSSPTTTVAATTLNNHHHHHRSAVDYDDDDDDDDDGEAGSIIPDRKGKHSFCRLCLTHSDTLNPLFPPGAGPDRALLAQISDCVEVQITLPDDIKSFICHDCVQQIYSFANFKELCKSNDQLLKSTPFAHESDNEEPPEKRTAPPPPPPEIVLSDDPTGNSEDASSTTPDVSLLEKLYEQGVEVEAIGGGQFASALLRQDQQHQFGGVQNEDDREAERKAKNAARMRRWRLRQREKQEKKVVHQQETIAKSIEQKDPAELGREDVLRMQQVQDFFAILAQQQLRQVEAEIKRLKSGSVQQTLPLPQQQQQQPLPQQLVHQPELIIKSEESSLQDGGESSRQTSPTSDQMASIRRSRAEYMRRWRAKRQTQQQTSAPSTQFGLVGRPPALSPAPNETEKVILQRHNRAEYMRRWRRERLKQELSPGEFDEWCSKSEQRRRFREWQAIRESASSAGDDTMDCGELEGTVNLGLDHS